MDPVKKQKYLKLWGLISLALIVVFPDVVYDTTTTILAFLFDHLVELGHIMIEAIEMVLDYVIEGVFETDLQSTQTIVFYLLLAGGIYCLYRLSRYLIRLCHRCKANWDAFQAKHQHTLKEYWQALTVIDKVKLIVIPSVFIYLYVMFFI